MLYALLTGRPPFQAASPAETLRQVLEQEPVLLRQLNHAVPRDLETIALKCLEKSPPRRYESAAALADDLDRWLAGEPIRARRIGTWERTVKWARRRPAVAGALGTVLLVAVLAFGLVTAFWLDEQQARLAAVDAEQKATLLAESEHKARVAAVDARENAKQAEREAKRSAVRLALDRGRTLCEQGHVGRGLLWMAATLEKAGTLEMVSREDAEFALAVRANLAAWGSQPSPLRGLLPHPGPVQSATFSPDGQSVLTASADHSVRLWNVAKGEPIGRLLEHTGPVLVALFSPRGEYILTGTKDGQCRLWQADTGVPIGTPWDHDAAVQSAAFSPDGLTVVTGGRSGRVRLWKTNGGKLLFAAAADGPVQAVAFSPDARTLATGSAKGRVQLWKAATLEPIGTLPWPPDAPVGEVWLVQFSPRNGAFLLAAVRNEQAGTGVVHLWRPETRKHLATLKHRWQIGAAAFSPDGQSVLTGGGDYMAQLWEAATGRPLLKRPLEHQDGVVAVAFSLDGENVLTGSLDCTVQLWNFGTGEPIGPPLEHPAPVEAVAFSPDGQFLVSGCGDGSVHVWDRATGTSIGPAWRHQGAEPFAPNTVWSVAWDLDGQTVWSGGDDRAVRQWCLPSPVAGDATQIRHWVQVITGMEFDQNQVAKWLDAATWRQRRQELQRLGGPPLP